MTDKENQNAVKHGGAAAVKRLQDGQPFTDLAATVQEELTHELDTGGQYEFVKARVLRIATAERLYWDAVQSAADKGLERLFEGRVKSWGWLVGVEMRALDQLNRMSKGKRETIDAIMSQEVKHE